MGRAYLHACVVEPVLNVLVEMRIDKLHFCGHVRIRVQFIGNVEVIQRSLQNERFGNMKNALGRKGRVDKQFMNRPPRSVIANGNGGVEDDSRRSLPRACSS